MALSEQELRALREIEQSLMADDPKFGSSVSGVGLQEPSFSLSLKVVAIFVLGLAVLVGGIALSQQNMWFVALSVLGFLIMFGAGIWGIRTKGSGESIPTPHSRLGNAAARPARGNLSQGGFTDRIDGRFRNRFEDRP